VQAGEQRHQFGIDDDRFRMLGEVEQRAVDVEKERDRAVDDWTPGWSSRNCTIGSAEALIAKQGMHPCILARRRS
jgi:hypothetical protein